MKLANGYPPNVDLIKQVFPITEDSVFAYGDTIFSPQGDDLRPDLIYHEHVHREQQLLAGGPEPWWGRYLTEPDFRFSQEAEAYHQQWKFVRRYTSSNIAKQALFDFALQLSSPLYQLDISYQEAERAIRTYGKTN